MAKHRRVLLIYTGGTIGMMKDPRTGALQPMDLEHLEDLVPELGNIPAALSTASLDPVMDSSDMGPTDWVRIAQLIAQHPDVYKRQMPMSDGHAMCSHVRRIMRESWAVMMPRSGSNLRSASFN